MSDLTTRLRALCDDTETWGKVAGAITLTQEALRHLPRESAAHDDLWREIARFGEVRKLVPALCDAADERDAIEAECVRQVAEVRALLRRLVAAVDATQNAAGNEALAALAEVFAAVDDAKAVLHE